MNHALGKHLIAELWVRDPHLLDQPESIQEALTAACDAGGFTVLKMSSHAFAPHGVTAVALLSESHISIHTWPEHAYAAVDIFTCGGSARKAMEELGRRLDVENMEVRELDRGIVGQAGARSPHSPGHRGVDIPRAV